MGCSPSSVAHRRTSSLNDIVLAADEQLAAMDGSMMGRA
jgi:hypothetical protein